MLSKKIFKLNDNNKTLLVLTGAPSVGKTTLAIAIARKQYHYCTIVDLSMPFNSLVILCKLLAKVSHVKIRLSITSNSPDKILPNLIWVPHVTLISALLYVVLSPFQLLKLALSSVGKRIVIEHEGWFFKYVAHKVYLFRLWLLFMYIVMTTRVDNSLQRLKHHISLMEKAINISSAIDIFVTITLIHFAKKLFDYVFILCLNRNYNRIIRNALCGGRIAQRYFYVSFISKIYLKLCCTISYYVKTLISLKKIKISIINLD